MKIEDFARNSEIIVSYFREKLKESFVETLIKYVSLAIKPFGRL